MADGFADGVVAGMASNDRSGYGYGYPVVPMYPAYGGGYGNSGFGVCGDWIWIIVLFALFGFGGNGFGGGFGGSMGMYPWIQQGQTNTDNLIGSGFNQAATASALSGIQNSLTTGFANAEIASCGRAADALNRSFDAQTAITSGINSVNTGLLNCCCENRAGLADLKYTVATENCADRQALNEGVRDIIANNTAGVQRILDKLCDQELQAERRDNQNLRSELMYARGQASQIEQTARILAGQNSEIDALYNRLSNCPVPSTPVYGRQPIFTCNNNGCGCGCNGNI